MSIEVGSKLQGKVTGITNFGAFVELQPGVTGLVHISEIADNYVKSVADHLKVGDEVTVKVINVDNDGKIGLSIKKAIDKPPAPERPMRTDDRGGRPRGESSYGGRGGGGGRGGNDRGNRLTFEDKMNRFLRDSEERISSLRKNTDSKRGGRGGRRD
jgi:S1 RNA binding domain protein